MKTLVSRLVVLMLLGCARLMSADPLVTVQLSAPRLRLASGTEVQLERVASQAVATFRAPAGSPAEGVTVTITPQLGAGEENYVVGLRSSVTLSDVQLVQPVLIGVDWRSYLRTLEDIAQCAPQMVVQKGQEWIWGKLPVGCVSERLMTMDGLRPTGYADQISTWAEIAPLHMARELPAKYRDERRGREARFSLDQ